MSDGGTRELRTLFAPDNGLKEVQRRVARYIEGWFGAHPIAHAYCARRGIVTNARCHLGARVMLHIDLKNFFDSIDQSAVETALRMSPDGLFDYERKALAELCCLNGRLPQGSPVSPVISNLVCYSLDEKLSALAEAADCRVSRYSDDITFSTKFEVLPASIVYVRQGRLKLSGLVRSILSGMNFKVNWQKVRVEARQTGLRVTGLMVTDSVAVPRPYRDHVRSTLDHWKRLGIEAAAREETRPLSPRAFAVRVRGRIGYIGQVHGVDSRIYQRLSATLHELALRDLGGSGVTRL